MVIGTHMTDLESTRGNIITSSPYSAVNVYESKPLNDSSKPSSGFEVVYSKESEECKYYIYPCKYNSKAPVLIWFESFPYLSASHVDFENFIQRLSDEGLNVIRVNYRTNNHSDIKFKNHIEDCLKGYLHILTHSIFASNEIYIGGHSSGALLASIIALDSGAYLPLLSSSKDQETTLISRIKGLVSLAGTFDLSQVAKENVYFNHNGITKFSHADSIQAQNANQSFVSQYEVSLNQNDIGQFTSGSAPYTSSNPERLIVPSPHNTERLIVPSPHNTERLIVPSPINGERLIVPGPINGERLIVPSPINGERDSSNTENRTDLNNSESIRIEPSHGTQFYNYIIPKDVHVTITERTMTIGPNTNGQSSITRSVYTKPQYSPKAQEEPKLQWNYPQNNSNSITPNNEVNNNSQSLITNDEKLLNYLRSVSPQYVTSSHLKMIPYTTLPKALIIHSTNDTLVHSGHSLNFAKHLNFLGFDKLKYLANNFGGHNDITKDPLIAQAILDFIIPDRPSPKFLASKL
ncbi:alpha/beta-hydrolase [Neoconidiobolus thromboides FSU 785]|nr:alpha/beta-hydrolase [Neoconidiobolus thromboides FSU 785]